MFSAVQYSELPCMWSPVKLIGRVRTDCEKDSDVTSPGRDEDRTEMRLPVEAEKTQMELVA